jgi:hypothetical protein
MAYCGDRAQPKADDRIGPGMGNQPSLWDGLAGALDKGDEDVQRAAAEVVQRHPLPEQDALRRYQSKVSEGEEAFFNHRRIVHERSLESKGVYS